MTRIFRSLRRDTQGATAIEYGLILGLIVLVVVIGIRGLGSENGSGWGALSSKSIAAMKAA